MAKLKLFGPDGSYRLGSRHEHRRSCRRESRLAVAKALRASDTCWRESSGSRSIVHTNVTAHPTAEWTSQQLRNALSEDCFQYLIHDNDSFFSGDLEEKIADLGIRVLRTPVGVPVANCYCEGRWALFAAKACIL